jgi:TonB family protein
MDTIVGVDGRPSSIRIIRSLDQRNGLDREAVKAMEQWRFKPGLHKGKPAPVQMIVEMHFSLKP